MSAPAEAPRQAAVVDVGSNSVRMVLYRLEGRAIWSVYNERVLCGLGRGVAETGKLSPEGAEAARSALRRFRAILDSERTTTVFAPATAAVREAKDGPAFVRAVREQSGFDLNVVSGEDEARLSALGVLAGTPEAEGVVGDLGGSSLELTPVTNGGVKPGVSLRLGPFALGAPEAFEPADLRRRIDKRLAEAPGSLACPTLYAVGGAWRNMAAIHMVTTDYPLRVVHGYELDQAQALQLCKLVAQQSRASLERIEGVGRKRAETLPYAATVLERVIQALEIKRIAISGYGVREGLLFETMTPEVQALDPLVEGAASLGRGMGAADLGPALETWLTPLFDAVPSPLPPRRATRLLAAACRMAELGARMHPDHRAELAADTVLRAPLAGQSHADRAFLAAAIWSRYGGGDGGTEPEIAARLLEEAELARARAVGLALRLGAELCGRNAALLHRAVLRRVEGALVLSTDDDADLLLGDNPRKRLAALAAALDLEPTVEGAGP